MQAIAHKRGRHGDAATQHVKPNVRTGPAAWLAPRQGWAMGNNATWAPKSGEDDSAI